MSFPSPSGPASESGSPERLVRRLSGAMLGAVGLLVVLTVAAQTGGDFTRMGPVAVPGAASNDDAKRVAVADLSAHPSTRLSPYFDRSAPLSDAAHPEVLTAFHDLLGQYVHRQVTDDNYTIRVVDARSNTLLERFDLDSLRRTHSDETNPDWLEVDERRRDAMERLVDKYEAQGVPLEDIIVRWGRANQVEAAHERGRPHRFYERRLAKALGLSLLATEIGTVETFNEDWRVSAAGALSRYQMLPWILRRSGVNEYTLPTADDTWIRVREERHPLLVLEPAFRLLRGYVNAVGHELPGLSAYHAGPGNIFKLYRRFYAESGRVATATSVADAYAWAVTEGFDVVREGSTFGGRSRGYVPALYGSLVARDDEPIQRRPAVRAVRVQVKPGASVSLRTLLEPLSSAVPPLEWGPTVEASSIYGRFRAFNPHLDLPPPADGDIPPAGNVQFLSSVDGKAVRFFLPLRAPEILRDAGVKALDSTATQRYDRSTFAPPTPDQVTTWDRKYQALIEDIEAFGFTRRNREQLFALHDRFEALAEQNPSRFRQRQLAIIRTHRRLWRSGPWEDLADATERVMGRLPVTPQPPVSLDTSDALPMPEFLPAPTVPKGQ